MAKKEVKSILRDVSQDEKPIPPLVEPEPQLKIDELTLLRMTRFMEKERAARMELQLTGAQLNGLFQQWLQTNDEARKMNARIAELQAEQKTAQDGYQKIVTDVGNKLKINMADYSFDDETGVLHPLTAPTPVAAAPAPPPPAPEPVAKSTPPDAETQSKEGVAEQP